MLRSAFISFVLTLAGFEAGRGVPSWLRFYSFRPEAGGNEAEPVSFFLSQPAIFRRNRFCLSPLHLFPPEDSHDGSAKTSS